MVDRHVARLYRLVASIIKPVAMVVGIVAKVK